MEALSFLYETRAGRILLAPLVSRPVSEAAGRFLDSPLSRFLIGPFVRLHHIRTEEYLLDDIRSFNDFFCRRIRPELRPCDSDPGKLIAPCDGLLTVCSVSQDLVIPVKQSRFSISDMLGNARAAAYFEGGTCWVFRLCVEHYHRYIYPVSGRKSRTVRIPGVYHTVRPVALRSVPVFSENAREVTYLKTQRGTIAQIEVGAMLVGRIRNHESGPGSVIRGEEKGLFQYGGSTVILLTPPGFAKIPERFQTGEEVPVRMGEAVVE